MTKKQMQEIWLSGDKQVSQVEVRAVEVGIYPPKPAEGKYPAPGEQHYAKYKVILNNDGASVVDYGPKGHVGVVPLRPFTKGQPFVVIGQFTQTKDGPRCSRCETFEALTN